MIINQDIILSKKHLTLNKLKNNFLANFKLFNLSRSESEVFWFIFNLYLKDSKLKLNTEEIKEKILHDLGKNLEISHLRNILNSLVRKKFLRAITLKLENSNEKRNTEGLDDLTAIIPENLLKNLILFDVFKEINEIEISMETRSKILDNIQARLVTNVSEHHVNKLKKLKNSKRGKKPRNYYFETDIIVKLIEHYQQKFINELVTDKHGFKLSEVDINKLLHTELIPEILDLMVYPEETNMKKFYKKILSSQEIRFLTQFGNKNTIRRLISKIIKSEKGTISEKGAEQKIRRLIQSLIDKNILKLALLSPEIIEDHKLINLSKDLRKNEKIYLRNSNKAVLISFLKEITEQHLKIIEILKKFIEIHDLFMEQTNLDSIENKKLINSPINEVFSNVKSTITSIEQIENEFNKLSIYKNIFEKLKLGLLIFEEGFLKEFNDIAENVFKINEFDIHELNFEEFINNEIIIFLSENGLKKVLIENFFKKPVYNYQWSGEVMVIDKINNKRNMYRLNILQSIEVKQVQIVTEKLTERDLF